MRQEDLDGCCGGVMFDSEGQIIETPVEPKQEAQNVGQGTLVMSCGIGMFQNGQQPSLPPQGEEVKTGNDKGKGVDE